MIRNLKLYNLLYKYNVHSKKILIMKKEDLLILCNRYVLCFKVIINNYSI